MDAKIKDVIKKEHHIDPTKKIKDPRAALEALNTMHKIRYQRSTIAKQQLEQATRKAPNVAKLKATFEQAVAEQLKVEQIDSAIETVLINAQKTTDTKHSHSKRKSRQTKKNDLSNDSNGDSESDSSDESNDVDELDLDSLVFVVTSGRKKLKTTFFEWEDLIEGEMKKDNLVEWIKLTKLKSQLEANRFIQFNPKKHILFCEKANGSKLTALEVDEDLQARVTCHLASRNRYVHIKIRKKKSDLVSFPQSGSEAAVEVREGDERGESASGTPS